MNKNWIFLRGWGRDSRHWGEFINLVKQTFEEDRIILYDVPGSGDYSNENCPASIPDIVDVLAKRWQDEHAGEKAQIVALSFGAMLAIDWMTRYPEMIQSAVLINGSSHLSSFYQRLNYKNYPALLLMPFKNHEAKEAKIIELTSNLYPSRKALITTWTDYAREKPVTLLNLMRQLWAAYSFRFPENKPAQPILLLNSLSDRLVNPDCSKMIAVHWQLPIHRHPAAGHDMTLDVPLWVIEQLKSWKNALEKKSIAI